MGIEHERLVELELRYTEQQELLQQLSDVLYAQQQRIDLLVAEVSQLRKKLQADPGVVDASANEKPPHY